MAIDLSQLSLTELDQLISDAQAMRQSAYQRAKDEAYARAVAAAKELGVSINDIFPTRTVSSSYASSPSEKTRKPRKQPEFHYAKGGNHWTGAGRAPAWMPDNKEEWVALRVPNPDFVAE